MFFGVLVGHADMFCNRRDLLWLTLDELENLQPQGI
jgi:hypothetical protein